MPRILSIEDDANLQHQIGCALFREGYEVIYAWNGKEGYEKIAETDPDLILLDLMLPVMNGVEFLKKLSICKPARHTPIVVITVYGDEAEMLKFSVEALGAVFYLRKPFHLDELVGTVKRILAQYPRLPRLRVEAEPKEVSKGCVRANIKFSTVWIDDRMVATLPPAIFALLRCLIESPGVVRREELLLRLGYQGRQAAALKQTVHRLRSALGPRESRRIKTTDHGYELIG
jgi:DNA-binding response OmpR family regulator